MKGPDAFAGRPLPVGVFFSSAAAFVGVLGLVGIVLTLRTGANLDHISGTWLTLGRDLASGVFYRPVFAEAIGYGGTRYQPLYFSAIAVLLSAGVPPVPAGMALSLFADGFLLGGVWLLLRRSGLSSGFALAWTALLFSSSSFRFGMTSIRSDVLAAGFSIWGLALMPRRGAVDIRTVLSGCLFALAFATKLTDVAGVAAAILALVLARKGKPAFGIAAIAGFSIIAVILITYAASSGRVLEAYRAGAGGGANATDFILGPAQIVWKLAQYDPVALVFFSTAVAALLAMPAFLLTPAGLYLACTTTVTAFIFASPGTESNHLIELHVASVVLLAAATSRLEGASKTFVTSLATIAGILAAVLFADSYLAGRLTRPRLAQVRAAIAALPQSGAPILSEDPLVPLEAGESPYLLDAFMLRLRGLREHTAPEPLLAKVHSHGFRAVVLLNDPQADWYSNVHFGRRVIDEVAASYRLSGRVGPYRIFVPR